jgi:glycosyltransferase involved in cell wall biosynthesis
MDLNWLYERGLKGLEREIGEVFSSFIDGAEPDVIHAHNLNYFSEHHGRILERIAGERDIPLVLTAHNAWDDNTFLDLTLDIKWDRIIAVSEFIRRELTGVGVPEDKVVTVHHGIDLQRFKEAQVGLRDRYPQLEDKRIIFHPARMGLAKGCDVAVKALRIIKEEFPDVLLVFTGTKNIIDWGATQQKDIAYVLHLIRRLGVEDNVFANVFSFEEIVGLYKASEFSIYPSSFEEPFGLTMLESMACGRPMIVTDSGGMPEVVKDGVNGFVIGKKNYQELAQRCSQLLKDGELRKELGERGRKIVEERFTDERMVKDTLRVYEETIEYIARREERKYHPVLA